jgi:hypothetical protein
MAEKVYFGSLRQAGWVKAPNPGLGASSEGSTDLMEYAGGGAFVSQSPAVHRTYDMAWDIGDESEFQFLRDYRSGELGTGLIYWVDPMVMRKNALPPHAARPEMSARGWPSLVSAGVEPERVSAGATVTNYATNPNMRTTLSTVATRTNLSTNPRGQVDTTTGSIAGGVTDNTLTTGATAGPTGGPSYVWTTSATVGTRTLALGIGAVAAGDPSAVSAMIKAPAGTSMTIGTRFYDAANAVISTVSGVVTADGTWTRYSSVGTVPALATKVGIYLSVSAVSTTLYITNILIERAALLSYFFDGISLATADYTYGFTGATGITSSVQTGLTLASTSQASTQSTMSRASGDSNSRAYSGSYFSRSIIVGTGAIGITWNMTAGIALSTPHTLLMRVRPSRNMNVTPRLMNVQGSTVSLPANVWTEIRQTINTPAASNTTTGLLLPSNSGAMVGDYVDVDTIAVIPGAYTGPYFDGASRFTDGRTVTWTGVADASTSTTVVTLPGMPVTAARYSITTPADTVPSRRTVLLIPDSMTLWLGYSGLATGAAVVRVQMISRDGSYGPTQDLTLLDDTGNIRLNSSFNGSEYAAVIIYITQSLPGSSQLRLTSAKAVYETTGITPVMTGTHVAGLGHSGLRFASGPTFAYILYNEEGNRKYVSAAARFVEVGSWV